MATPIPNNQPIVASTMSYPINPKHQTTQNISFGHSFGTTCMPASNYYSAQPMPIHTAVMSATWSGYPSWATTISPMAYGTISDPAKVGDSVRSRRKIKLARRVIIGVIIKVIENPMKKIAVVEEASTGKTFRIETIDLERISPLDVLVEIEKSKGRTHHAGETVNR